MARKRRSRLRDLAEYALVRGTELALRPMPRRLALRIGRALGRLACLVDRRHRVVAVENAAAALGLSPAEARGFVRRVYANVGATAVECLLLPHDLRRKSIGQLARVEGAERLRAALERGKGAIIITGHIGNWEINGLAVASECGSLLSVARELDNPLLEEHLRRVRERLGQEVVDRHGALRRVVRHLRANGVVAMLIDQNQRRDGVFVDFFGRLASTVPSPARIALRYGVPVLPACGHRTEDGRTHLVRIEPPVELIRTDDLEADVVANTALFTRRIEGFVREHPDQWFWLHSRWRKRPRAEKRAALSPSPSPAEVAPLGRPAP